jgi:acetyl esterase/lipase
MPLDSQAQIYLDRVAALGLPPVQTLTPQENRRVRARLLELRREMAGQRAAEAVAHVEERRMPVRDGSVAARIYVPEGVGPFPVMVYFFGGGFIMGSIDAVDEACRAMARRSGCMVVSAEYRLAPEHKFPGPVEDGFAAVSWVAEHAASFGGDASRLAVGGESAGGNIAAVACHLGKARGGPPIALQVLIYPPLDFTAGRSVDREIAGQATLTDERMAYFDGHYFRTAEDANSPLASPVLADDLGGLPDALILTAEFDPLAAEGAAYADRLRRAGVRVTLSCYAGMIHGFFSMLGVFWQADEAIDQVAAELRAVLKPS